MKQTIKKARRDPIIKNIKNLQETILKTEAKNNAKYAQIIKLNTSFQFKLFKAVIPSYQTRQQLSLAQNIMMKQIDKLMQDQQKLNIQLDRHQYKMMEQEKKMQKQIMLDMDHFTFLRTIWKKDQNLNPSDNKVDKLIHNVGSIKGHILNLIKKQVKYRQSPPQIHQMVVSSPQYCQLQKKYQQLKAQNERLSLNDKQQITNNTSQSSIESQDQKKQNENLQIQLAKLKLQLLNKNREIQRLKKDKRFSGEALSNGTNGTNNDLQYDNLRKFSTYKVSISDGCYQMIIKQNPKSQQQSQKQENENKQQRENIKQLTTRQTLQQILRFLQGNNLQSRKIGRISLMQNSQAESKRKKFTVQQIARPKFISNKQIVPNKIQQAEVSTQ